MPRVALTDGTRIVNNQIYSNHNERAATKAQPYPSFGNGIVAAGEPTTLLKAT